MLPSTLNRVEGGESLTGQALESVLFFETPTQLYARIFRMLKPRTAVPEIQVEFCPFANANAFIRFEAGRLYVRIADLLQEAPAPILEALAVILLSKLYRRPVARAYSHRYKLYLNRRDVRQRIHEIRSARGRKHVGEPTGRVYDLTAVFEDLNVRFFGGMMARPQLGWSLRPSRTTLGHYDPSHHAIVLSSILDRDQVPRLAVEYVMFHEMLHLRFPVEHRGARRCVHTREFKAAESQFPELKEAKQLLRQL